MNYIYSKEQIQQAQSLNLVQILEARGEQFEPSGREKRMKSDHSVTIRDSMWYDHSAQEGGGPLEFFKKFHNMTFKQAMETLVGQPQELVQNPSYRQPSTQHQQATPQNRQQQAPPHLVPSPRPQVPKTQEFQLPNRNTEMKKTFAYLASKRKIDFGIISHFAKARTLYESSEIFKNSQYLVRNCVFVGTDENGNPRHAHKHGLNFEGDTFKRNVQDSEAQFSFHHVGKNEHLFVFEAPIDMLSFISIYQQDWQESSYVALCGTSGHAIEWMLNQNPQLQNVVLCLDNDHAGIQAVEKLSEQFKNHNPMPYFPTGKDWNEDLIEMHSQMEQAEQPQSMAMG